MSRRRRERAAASARPPAAPPPPARGGRPALAALLAAVISALWFLPAVRGAFLNWDDPQYLTENFALQRLSGAGAWWDYAWQPHAGNWHPLTWLAHAAAWRAFGGDPAGHHLLQVILHAVNAALLALLAAALLARHPAWSAAAPSRRTAASLFAALLFALHPLRVESIAWCAELKDPLHVGLCLAAALAHLRSGDPGAPRGWRFATIGAGGLAMLAKGSAIALLPILILADWGLGRLREPRAWARANGAVVLALSGLAGWTAARVVDAGREFLINAGSLSALDRIFLAVRGFGWYLGKFFAPVGLSPLVPLEEGLAKGATGWGWIALAAAASLYAWRRRGAWAAAWMQMLVTLLPVSGLLQVGNQAVADRFSYLAQAGLAIVCAASIVGAGRDATTLRRRALIAAGLVWLALLAAGARVYLPTFGSPDALWDTALTRYPEAGVAWANRAAVRELRGELDGAADDYERADRFSPQNPAILASRAGLELKRGRLALAASLAERASAISPDSPFVRVISGQLRLQEGRAQEAAADFDAALARNPWLVAALAGRGRARMQAGDAEGGEADLRAALALKPEDDDVRADYAALLAQTGRPTEARELLDGLIARGKGGAEALVNRGILRVQAGDAAGAREDFEAAARAAPDSADAHLNALLLARMEGRAADARAHYDALRRINPADPGLRAAAGLPPAP